MKTAATHHEQDNRATPALYLAFELGETTWKLGFTTGAGQRPRLRTVTARDVAAVLAELERAKVRFGFDEFVRVVSCYEAGRDGFWLHRCLVHHGIENLVVDSSSIEVKRRSRRAKTDRLDVGKLLSMLLRYCGGEQKVWSVVHVPTVEAEDRRQLHRELLTVKRDRTRVTNRIKGLLSSQGVVLSLGAGFVERLDAVGMWDGSPMPRAGPSVSGLAALTALSASANALACSRSRRRTLSRSHPGRAPGTPSKASKRRARSRNHHHHNPPRIRASANQLTGTSHVPMGEWSTSVPMPSVATRSTVSVADHSRMSASSIRWSRPSDR